MPKVDDASSNTVSESGIYLVPVGSTQGQINELEIRNLENATERGLEEASLPGAEPRSPALPKRRVAMPKHKRRLADIPIDSIVITDTNLRKSYRDDDFRDLIKSLKEFGQVESIIVRETDHGAYL